MSSFVDVVQVNLRGGDGGAGAVSFRREAHVPKGGPDGGDGGSGGDVYVQADRNVASLLAFRDHPHRRAESGKHGSGNKRHGSSGSDLVVTVPEGTQVKTRDGELLADLVRHGDRYLAAHGGRGGRGNARFLSNARPGAGLRRAGRVRRGALAAPRGQAARRRRARSASRTPGSRRLIAAISAAKPKIADYPFTTLEPNLGVVRFRDHEFVVADIPGLIEGAAEGRGLGHQFLRHVERARVLVLLLDLAAVDEREPEEQERVLLDELGRYRPELLERPRLVVGSQGRRRPRARRRPPGGRRRHRDLGRHAAGPRRPARPPRHARRRGARRRARAGAVRGAPPRRGRVRVVRDDDGAWRVTGRNAERVVAMADLTNVEAMEYVQHRLRKMGVERALARAGAREGDLVRIGPVELDYFEGIG